MTPKQLKSAVKAAAKAFLFGPERRLDKWTWHERGVVSVIDRALLPVKYLVLLKLEELGVSLDEIGKNGVSHDRLHSMIQDAVGKYAHVAEEEAKNSLTPRRDGRLVFTVKEMSTIPPFALRCEVSRHDHHVLTGDQKEAAEYQTAQQCCYNDQMIELLVAHDKTPLDQRKLKKPLLNPREIIEIDRVGSSAWQSPVTLFSQVSRQHHESKGAGTHQNGRGIRSAVDFDESVRCGDKELLAFQTQLKAAFDVDGRVWEKVLANPLDYLRRAPWGKDTAIVIRYCLAIKEIKDTGSSPAMAGYDMPASLLMLIFLILGVSLDEIEKIACCNSRKFVHARKRVLKVVRNKLTHALDDVNLIDFEADVIKPCFTKGGYGAAAKAIAMVMLGLEADEEDSDETDAHSTILQFLAAGDAVSGPEAPECIAHWFEGQSDEYIKEHTVRLCDMVLRIMMSLYPQLSVFVQSTRDAWIHGVNMTGEPPHVTAYGGYTVMPSVWRRDKKRYRLMETNFGVGKYVVPKPMYVNRYVQAAKGTPFPPMITHHTEGTGMTYSCLDAKKRGIAFLQNMDWYATHIGNVPQLHKSIVTGVNHATSLCVLEQIIPGMPKDTPRTKIPLDWELTRL